MTKPAADDTQHRDPDDETARRDFERFRVRIEALPAERVHPAYASIPAAMRVVQQVAAYVADAAVRARSKPLWDGLWRPQEKAKASWGGRGATLGEGETLMGRSLATSGEGKSLAGRWVATS